VESAERLKGEETYAPLPGLLTVTPANAGSDRAGRRRSVQRRAFFMGGRMLSCPCMRDLLWGPSGAPSEAQGGGGADEVSTTLMAV